MTEKLEKLITYAIADGLITDKEREILVKNANEEGLDLDEFEMILEGRLFEKQQELKISNTSQTASVSQNKSNKEGDLKKCPSCGSPALSFKSSCSECGHEFRNVDSVSSFAKLSALLEEIEKVESERFFEANQSNDSKEKYNQRLFRETVQKNQFDKLISEKKSHAIVNFPVPNSKEDILEFLAQSYSKGKPVGFWFGDQSIQATALRNAWKTKCEEVIIKGKFLLREDPKIIQEIEYYAQELKKK